MNGRVAEDAAWSYEHPSSEYELIRGCLAFYASKADKCFWMRSAYNLSLVRSTEAG